MDLKNIWTPLGEFVNRNARILTIFAVSLIVLVGVTIREDPSHWWISMIAVSIIFIGILLIINARVFIKSVMAILIIIFEASWAYEGGIQLTNDSLVPGVWMITILLNFFLLTTLSYILITGRSRWMAIALSETISFVITFTLIGSNLNPVIAVILSLPLTYILFYIIYKYNRKSAYKKSKMPDTVFDVAVYKKMGEQFLDGGLGAKILKKRNGNNSIIVWTDDRAYHMIFVDMKQEFGNGGIKSSFLTYDGKNINPWLINLAMNYTPLFRTRGAPMLTILLDKNDKNGKDFKVIGVQIPDTKNKVPVGIAPAHRPYAKGEYVEYFKKLDDEYKDFTVTLTPRQVKNLDKLLPDVGESL